MNFFGSRKKTPAASKPASNTPIEAIGKLKEQLRVMEKGGTHLEARIKKCHMDALKKSKAKNKRGAMLDLKRKKLLEKQLSQKQAQQFNLENQLFALENANSNKQMLDTMKQANGAMAGVMNSVYVFSFVSWWLPRVWVFVSCETGDCCVFVVVRVGIVGISLCFIPSYSFS